MCIGCDAEVVENFCEAVGRAEKEPADFGTFGVFVETHPRTDTLVQNCEIEFTLWSIHATTSMSKPP